MRLGLLNGSTFKEVTHRPVLIALIESENVRFKVIKLTQLTLMSLTLMSLS